MRFFLITSYYPPFIENFRKKHPALEQMNYDEALRLLLSEFFADTGCIFYWLRQNGHEAFISISNFELLQKKWAQENNIAAGVGNWSEAIMLAQMKAFRPDIVYTESVQAHSEPFLKQAAESCRRIVAWISFPFEKLPDLRHISLVVTSTRDYVKKFRAMGMNSEYMLPAFDSRVAEFMKHEEKSIDFSFVGGLSPVHKNRWEALNYLCRNCEIGIWGYGLPPRPPLHKRLFRRDEYSLIRRHHHGEVWGLEMYAILSRSLITFNIHEALLKGDVGNMRMFEATGVGTMLLNDHGGNLSELFEPGVEVVTYKSLPEAVEKYRYYHEHRHEAIAIGKKAQQRTLSSYNYNVFVNSLSSVIHKYMK